MDNLTKDEGANLNMCSIKKFITSDILFYFILFALSLFDALREPGLPGVYYDAVNPDFFALHILNPGFNNGNLTNYIGVPFIGALYHGTVTMFFMFAAILIVGKTSAALIWIVNSIYGFFISLILYKLLKRAGISERSSKLCAALLLLSPNMFTYFRTQFYILLPGALFLLAAIWFAFNWRDGYRYRNLIACGVFSGLAVYDYFIWLFWLPAVLIILLYRAKKLSALEILNNVQIYIIAFLLGCSFYILGYIGGVLYNLSAISYTGKEIIYVICIVLIYSTAICMIIFLCNEKLDIRKKAAVFWGIVLLAAVVGVVVLLTFLPLLSKQINRLDIFVNKAGFTERLTLFYKLICGVLNNFSGEMYLLGEATSVYSGFIAGLAVLLFFINILFLSGNRNRDDQKYRAMFYILICSLLFCLLSFPLVHRMGYHHFIGFCVAEYAFLFVNIDIAGDNLKILKDRSGYSVLRSLPGLIVAFAFLLCLINQTRIILKLDETSGPFLYTENINLLSAQALENKHQGKKELYVFPEWGFKAGFNFLTMNEVRYYDELDEDILYRHLDEGYVIKLCLWKEYEETEQYLKTAESMMKNKAKEKSNEMIGRKGNVDILIYEFYPTER